jgi:hypothetical protein
MSECTSTVPAVDALSTVSCAAVTAASPATKRAGQFGSTCVLG